MWPTNTSPSGYLICDGSEQPVATYPNLDAVLGTTFGARTNGSGGAGSTHFRLPDFRGRVALGVGTASPAVPGGTAHTLAQKGGEETHLLTAAESGTTAHGHTVSDPGHTHQQYPINWYVLSSGSNSGVGGTTLPQANDPSAPTGGAYTNVTVNNATAASAASAHNNLDPYLSINFIIKT
jgi:Microcystin-dependent protein